MRKFVKPVGSSIYLPEQDRCVLAEGETVEVTGYIERLIANGDLRVIPDAKKVTKKTEFEQEQESEG